MKVGRIKKSGRTKIQYFNYDITALNIIFNPVDEVLFGIQHLLFLIL